MDHPVLLHIESSVLYFTGNQSIKVKPYLKIMKGLTVLTGRNGSGKSTFARILERGRNFRTNSILPEENRYPNIRCLEFNDVHSFTGLSVSYYQQRYEATMNEDVPFVADILGDKAQSHSFKEWRKLLGLQNIEKKRVNYLSSGELRKLLIINVLLESPDLLVLDNPYIGLDISSKEILDTALLRLKNEGRSLLLILPEKSESPEFADHFLYAENLAISDEEPLIQKDPYNSFHFESKPGRLEKLVEMKDCQVKYGNTIVIDNLNWIVRAGERWCLSGPNGSGKSTLLSLINADNPKSYSNNISLFGIKRGSGESIWDIKRNIGYVSPEMQMHFHGSGTVLQIIANGLNDTVGLFVKPTATQIKKAEKWLEHFRIKHLKDRLFSTLSSGERQLVLVARAMIKQPRLLILDEPMHALDSEHLQLVQSTISEFLDSNKNGAMIIVTHNPNELPSDITFLHKKL